MVLGVDYFTCAALLAASIDEKCLGEVKRYCNEVLLVFQLGAQECMSWNEKSICDLEDFLQAVLMSKIIAC